MHRSCRLRSGMPSGKIMHPLTRRHLTKNILQTPIIKEDSTVYMTLYMLLVILFLALKCRASFLQEPSQQFLCITLHNLNLGTKSKKPLVQNPNETCKPLKKALENWIKLAISQSGPAAMLKQKGLCAQHTGRNCALGCFSLISSLIFSRELLSKGGQILLQASLFSVSS